MAADKSATDAEISSSSGAGCLAAYSRFLEVFSYKSSYSKIIGCLRGVENFSGSAVVGWNDAPFNEQEMA